MGSRLSNEAHDLIRHRGHWLAFKAAVAFHDGPLFVYPDDFIELLRNVFVKRETDAD
jgi:hypothetical protein